MKIMAAPNGARRMQADHPKLPVKIPEIVQTAAACLEAGADALHLHVRDENGQHSIDPGLYREALGELEAVLPTMPVQVTTESAGVYDVTAQLKMLESLKPSWASISLRETALDRGLAQRIYERCALNSTKIQHIIYDKNDAKILAGWQALGLIEEEPSVLLVLGRYSKNLSSDPDELESFLGSLPTVGNWMLCAFGPNEHASLLKAAALGGDLRVGFENSVVKADGTPWVDMAESVSALRKALDVQSAPLPQASKPCIC